MSRAYRRWSPDEIDRLHRLYPKHGPTGTARYLDRTPDGVRYQAQKQGIRIGLGGDIMLTAEVARMAGRGDGRVRAAARRDGEARRVGGRVIVPKKWAMAYIEAARDRNEAEALRDTWLTTAQFARRLGVKRHSVSNALREHDSGALANAMRGVRTARGKRWELLIHPHDAERAERAYREASVKYRSDAWISFAEAARRWGVPERIIRDRRRKVRRHYPLHAVLHSLTVERDASRWGRPAMLRADEVDARADEVRAAYRAGRRSDESPMTGGGQSTGSSRRVGDAKGMGHTRRLNDRGHDRGSSGHDPGHAVPR